MLIRRGTSLPILGRGTPIRLIIAATESNGSGTGNNLNELPTGALSSSPLRRTLIFDGRNLNGNGAGWTRLIPGHMEQQPGNGYGAGVAGTSTDNTNASFTNTVGWIGRFDQIVRTQRPNDIIGIIQNVEGGGRTTDTSTRGRNANYDPQFSDGAYNTLRSQVRDAVDQLLKLGYYIAERTFIFDFGGNDAIQGTTGTTWYNSIVAFFNALYRDRIISPTDRVIFNSLGTLLTGAGGIPNANRVANNTQINNLVALDPFRRSVIPSDDQTPMTYYWNGSAFGTDPIHLSAAGQWVKGEKYAFEWLRKWYPEWENMNGGAAKIIHARNFGDYRNVINSQTLSSGNLQTLMDWAGLSTPTQATGASQPAIGARTLPNGLLSRYATFNGTSHALITTVPTMYNRTPSVMSGVLKAASQTNGVPFSEGGAATNTPVVDPFYNASAAATFILKNNAGTLVGPTSLGSGLYDNNWNQFLFEDDGSNARLDINGVAGTPVTSTRGTFTQVCQAFGCQRYNNNTQSINFFLGNWVIEHEWDAQLGSAVKPKLTDYYRWMHGSN